MKKITLSQALIGYELAFHARNLSENTLKDYQNTFRKFQAFLGADPCISDITIETIQAFLASNSHLAGKTILNYHIGLSSLWEWATGPAGAVKENLLHKIKPPRPGKPDIIPFSEADIRLILSTIKTSKTYTTHGVLTSHSIPNADRNRAIVLTLLDTGIRATELCNLKIKDCQLRTANKIITIEGGKGDKCRHVPISARTAQAIWAYLAARPGARLTAALFATSTERHIDRNNLGNMLEYCQERSGVPNIHPHRFRHTFAINFLRNGGNVYALQAILGHESLKTCLKYLQIAQTDLDDGHRQASPVENWRL